MSPISINLRNLEFTISVEVKELSDIFMYSVMLISRLQETIKLFASNDVNSGCSGNMEITYIKLEKGGFGVTVKNTLTPLSPSVNIDLNSLSEQIASQPV